MSHRCSAASASKLAGSVWIPASLLPRVKYSRSSSASSWLSQPTSVFTSGTPSRRFNWKKLLYVREPMAAWRHPPPSIAHRQQRLGQLAHIIQSSRQRRHVGAGNPRGRLKLERHSQRQSLPLHATIERAVGAADDPVRRQKQSGADRVGEGRNQSGPALETRQGILFDRQRVQLRTQPVGWFFPIGFGRVLGGKVRLPKRNVANAADAEHSYEAPALLAQ